MALNTEEIKSVAINVWNRVNSNPGYAYSQRAFEKMAMQEFHKVVLAKQRQDENPVRIDPE